MCGRLILHVNDEATTFELPPGTHCHSSGRARVVSAASEMSTLRRKVTCHCTVSPRVITQMQSKYQPRCMMKERGACHAPFRSPPALKALQNEPFTDRVELDEGHSAARFLPHRPWLEVDDQLAELGYLK